MLNLKICTVIIMKKKKHKKKKKYKKKNNDKKKIMQFPSFEPGIHWLKVHQDSHFAMEANAIFR